MFSSRDLKGLDAALAVALKQVEPAARAVVSKGSLNIKTDAQQRAPHGPHTPYYASSITYDLYDRRDEISSQIGPDKNRKQGALGNIFELGTPGHPPKPHLVPAADAEEPRFQQHVADLGVQLLKDYL